MSKMGRYFVYHNIILYLWYMYINGCVLKNRKQNQILLINVLQFNESENQFPTRICTRVSLLYVVHLSVYMLVHKYPTNCRRNSRIYFATVIILLYLCYILTPHLNANTN